MRDTEIDVLREFGDALLKAAIQVQSYTFAIPREERLQTRFQWRTGQGAGRRSNRHHLPFNALSF